MAVIQSGGKQYSVVPGQQLLVGRLDAEPGSEVTLERVLLHGDGDQLEVGTPLVEGITVTARVIGHRRGPKVMAFRYKSKKNVRVHKGARADLTAIEVLAVGDARAESASRGKQQGAAKTESNTRGRAAKPSTDAAAEESE